uniref:Uncharacterized protein n=1 Tax=Glossina palpalis gambiensis TaxID=67801 RepID=A0A1B0BT91_9MUSC
MQYDHRRKANNIQKRASKILRICHDDQTRRHNQRFGSGAKTKNGCERVGPLIEHPCYHKVSEVKESESKLSLLMILPSITANTLSSSNCILNSVVKYETLIRLFNCSFKM